jgi:hypothetical protein
MVRRILLLAGSLAVLASGARADTTGGAMKSFGLVGAWSTDCAGDFRAVYDIPWFGQPTLKITFRDKEQAVYEIQSATQITDEKIKLSWLVTMRFGGSKPNLVAAAGEKYEAIYQKVGSKYNALMTKQMDGAKIFALDGFLYEPVTEDRGETVVGWKRSAKQTPLFEKCLNQP